MTSLTLGRLVWPGAAWTSLLVLLTGCTGSAGPQQTAEEALTATAAMLAKSDSSADATSAPGSASDLPLRSNPLRRDVVPNSPQPTTAPTKAAGAGLPATKAIEAPASPAAPKKTFGKKGKHAGEKFDPIKANGAIFEGWPKPKLALVITGRQDGYLEPCGCAGLEFMKGGLGRRHVMFEKLRADGWPLAALDVGGLIKGYGKQTELKFQVTVEGMRKMGYDAIALGKNDLRLPAAELVAVVAGVPGKETPFVSANVGLFGFDAAITPRKKIIQAGGLKLGITAVLGQEYQKEISNNREVEVVDAGASLAKVLPELKKERCDLLILLAHATTEETEALALKFPDFPIVVTSAGGSEPPLEQARLFNNRTRIVEVGEKGANAIVLGLYDARGGGLEMRYQRVPLDSRFGQSPDMKALMKTYQGQLQALGLGGLQINPAPHPQAALLGAYVGSAKCESCHEPSYDVWKKTGHAKAYKTLVEADPPRNYDPECISCHVVGWHPTQHFPYVSGYTSKDQTPHLANVGCESCHGPGEKHCEAELPGKTDEVLKEKLRKAMVVTKAEAEKRACYECHDLDNSPDFDFPSYWPEVEHHEKE